MVLFLVLLDEASSVEDPTSSGSISSRVLPSSIVLELG